MRNLPLIAIKLIGFALIVPLILGLSQGFQRELASLKWFYYKHFIWGVGFYVFMNLFVYRFSSLYEYGQKVISNIFQIFGPMGYFLTRVFPLYSILTLLIYFLLNETQQITATLGIVCSFLTGFFLSMHVILTSETMQEEDGGGLVKPTYFLMMGATFILTILIMALLFKATMDRFSFIDFFNSSWIVSLEYYKMLFEKIL